MFGDHHRNRDPLKQKVVNARFWKRHRDRMRSYHKIRNMERRWGPLLDLRLKYKKVLEVLNDAQG